MILFFKKQEKNRKEKIKHEITKTSKITSKNKNEEEDQHPNQNKFLVKKIFVPNTNTKTENIGSTRPPTSSSKSFKSVNFSKSDLSTNINNFINY